MMNKKVIVSAFMVITILSVSLLAMGCEEGVTSFYYENGELYTVDSDGASFDAVDIDRIEIDWISGDISVKATDSGEIKFYEGAKSNLDDSFRLHYYLDGTCLRLKFMESTKTVKLHSIKKKLYIELPKSFTLPMLQVNSVSGDMLLEDVTVEETKLQSVSGYIDVDGLSGRTLTISSVSGKTSISTVGLSRLEVESVSGTVTVTQRDAIYHTLYIETVSGRVNVNLPENDGFTLVQLSVSGDMSCAFELNRVNKTYTHKNGAADFKITTVNGNVFIKKVS